VPSGTVYLFAFGCAPRRYGPTNHQPYILVPGESVTTELEDPAQLPGSQPSSVVHCDRESDRTFRTDCRNPAKQSPAAQPCTRLHPPFPTTHQEECYAVRHNGPSTRGYAPPSLTPREQSSTRPVTSQYGKLNLPYVVALGPPFFASRRLSKNVDTIYQMCQITHAGWRNSARHWIGARGLSNCQL
jgi:hypothetical protein